MVDQLRGVGGVAVRRVEVGEEGGRIDGRMSREGGGQIRECLTRFYIQPEENMADFRSVVSYGLFGSAIKSVSLQQETSVDQLYLYVFFQISTSTTQEWNL